MKFHQPTVRFVAATVLASIFVVAGRSDAATWVPTVAGTYNWTDNANWTTPATFPNAVDSQALFNNNLAGNQIVNLNNAITVGTLQLGDNSGGQTATIAPNGGSLTFDVTSGNAALRRTNTGTGATEISANITLNDSLDIDLVSGAANSTMTLSGAIGEDSAGKGITKNSSTLTLVISGTTANNFTGLTTVNAGIVNLGKTDNVNAIGGNLTINSGGDVAIVGVSPNADQIPDSALVTINAGGILSVRRNETIGGLAGSGTVRNNFTGPVTAQTLSIGGGDVTSSFTGSLTDGGAPLHITKVGTGKLTLTGSTNNYTGTTTISGGTLELSGGNNRLPTATTVNFNGNGTLDIGSITQTVGTLSSGGSGITGIITASGGTLNYATLSIAPSTGQTSTIRNTGAMIVATGAGGTYSVGGASGAGNGTYEQTAGSLNATGSANAFNIATAVSSTGLVDISGGSLTTNSMRVGARSNGTLTISGATTLVTVGGTLIVGDGSLSAGANGTVNLNGGTLNTNLVTSGSTTQGLGEFNFAGGTLQAAATNTSFMVSNPRLTVNVKDGGAKIDTQTFDITIDEPLLHFAGATTDSLTKLGSGKLTLTGDNTYTGATTVSNGTLALSHATSNNTIAASPTITLGSNTFLDVAGLAGTADLILASGQTLQGVGMIQGNLTVGNNATIAPGASPGTMFQVGNQTWANGGTFAFDIDNADGTVGLDPGWSLLDISGTGSGMLDLTSLTSFTIDIDSLLHPSHAVGALDVDPDTTYVWDFVHASGGILNFNAAAFSFNTDDFTSTVDGSFSIRQTANRLELVFQTIEVQAVPEPGSMSMWVMFATMVIGAGYRYSAKRATK